MKTLRYLSVLGMCSATFMRAEIFTDALNDTVGGSGHYMDISSVEVTNDAANLYFSLSTMDNAAFVADGFARFMVGIDSVEGGESATNAWSNLITMPGMDYFGGGFTDSGSGAAINFHSSALGSWPEWQSGDNTWVAYSEAVADSTGVSFSVPLSALGLEVGDAINFDVYTGWETGYAMDAVGLSDGTLTQDDWASAYDSGDKVLSYTITLDEMWGGYVVHAESGIKTVDTGTFLGWLEITHDPWVYSYTLERYIFLPEASIEEAGAWSYIPNPGL